MLRLENTMSEEAMGQYPISRWLAGQAELTEDWVAEEVPVALVYNGLSHAVMMCTPQDLEDFARGFSLSECIVESSNEIYDIQVAEQVDGIQISLTIAQSRFWALKSHRRSLVGRTGCGLCGKESLAQLTCSITPVHNSQRISSSTLQQAMSRIKAHQHLFNMTGSAHAAAWSDSQGSICCLREDVGRHNALDKLIGHCTKGGQTMDDGLLIMTSRASYEIVQKAAACGISMIAAISGPTGMAVRLAEELGVALIGFARNDSLCVYAHPERIF